MGVQFSSGSGVVNGSGISSRSPLHKLVGVAVMAEISVGVELTCIVGNGVLDGGTSVGVGTGVSSSMLAQAVNRKMPICVRVRIMKLKFLRVVMVSPPKVDKREVETLLNHTNILYFVGVILA